MAAITMETNMLITLLMLKKRRLMMLPSEFKTFFLKVHNFNFNHILQLTSYLYCATIFSYISRALCDGKTENKDVNQNSLIGGNTAKPIILCPDMDEEKIREIKGIGI